VSSEELGAWRCVQASVVFAIHDRQLAEHGGMDGIRDRGAIESARAPPGSSLACSWRTTV
jgi:prophage maintenance system killer protein